MHSKYQSTVLFGPLEAVDFYYWLFSDRSVLFCRNCERRFQSGSIVRSPPPVTHFDKRSPSQTVLKYFLKRWRIALRDGSGYQNWWIFGKLPKEGEVGGGGSFSSQKFIYCRFWTFIEFFCRTISEKNCNLIFWGLEVTANQNFKSLLFIYRLFFPQIFIFILSVCLVHYVDICCNL